ncbi:MAG: hypothetical protein IJ693_12290, partial [Bacteroidaceae bacterium]|nr:hypothetical protein [Bacteroidaceae bacterium]
MKVDLFIHGVPNGEGFWGKEDDRNYFGTFYDHSTDEVKFVIQNRVSKGKPYCYYNYLVYKTVGSPTPNVVANDGRDGSYFGISLRIDAYCKDVMNMYRILDTIYNIYVWGDLLKMERSKLKYSFSDFSNIEAKLKNIENATFKLVQNGFYADSFMPLDGFSNSGGNVPVFNLYEMTAADALQAVKQYGKIIVSPYYPTMRERQIQQQCDSQIAVFRQQWDREKTELNSSLTPLKEQVSALRQDISTRDNTISQLQRDLQNAKQNKNISQLVATLKDPITELSRTLRTILPDTKISHTTSSQPSVLKKVSLFAPIVNFWLLVLLICLLGLILNKETVHQSEVPPHVVEVITD